MAGTFLTGPQIAALRLQTLGIVAGEARTPVDVVRHLLALQAQDFTASRWVIGCRADGADEQAIFDAFDSGQIVRSWPMRGTVHVTMAEDMPWMLDLAGVRTLSPSTLRRRWQSLGIDEARLERSREIAVELLRGGRSATRPEFTQTLIDAGIETSGSTAYHTVWYLSQTKTLVHGPTRDGEPTLVLLDEWIPSPRVLGRDDALRELVTRYLGSHGPATVEDIVWWSGLTKGDIRRGIEAAGEELVPVTHATTGAALLMTAEARDRYDPDPKLVARQAFALTAFDEHLLGFANRDDVLDRALAPAIDPARNGMFRPTIVHGGRVVATWKATRRARGMQIDVTALTPLSAAALKRATAALDRWSTFRGQELLAVKLVS